MAGGFVDEERAKAALIADGIISEKLINELEKTALIQEAVGDHYDVTEVRGGKLGLKQKHSHGMSNHRDNLNALLMAIDSEMNGAVVNHRPGMGHRPGLAPLQGPIQETYGDKRLRMALTDMLSLGGASELAKPGLRAGAMTGMPKEQRMNRAINYALKLNNGYDEETGSRLTMGLAGGHKFPHHKYPELSSQDFYIKPENKYVNRAQGDREGSAKVTSLINSFKKKLGTLRKRGKVALADTADLWNVGSGFD